MYINSNAVDMANLRPYGLKIDFVRNPIAEKAVRFFFIILMILNVFMKWKFPKKNPDIKIISFSKADFHKSTSSGHADSVDNI